MCQERQGCTVPERGKLEGRETLTRGEDIFLVAVLRKLSDVEGYLAHHDDRYSAALSPKTEGYVSTPRGNGCRGRSFVKHL